MSKIYTNEGWVNWEYIISQNAAFTQVVGARGTGKTYGLIRYLVENEKKFIYLRRLKSQLDQCGKEEGNPFKRLNMDLVCDIHPFPAGGVIAFRHGDKMGEVQAVGVALSVVANVRGVDFSDIDYIVFDEFISSEGERPIKNEFYAFLNFYETVNRNRELQGRDPVKVFMLGNANRLSNPYFTGWHFMKTALKMIKGNQMVWRSNDNSRLVIMLLQSPISKRKTDTVLYQNASNDFINMAIDNAFRTDATQVKSEPLKEYRHIVSIGEIGIYKHKSERKYYVSSVISTPYYEAFGIGLKTFRNDYYLLSEFYLTNKIVWFECYENEIIFREYFKLT